MTQLNLKKANILDKVNKTKFKTNNEIRVARASSLDVSAEIKSGNSYKTLDMCKNSLPTSFAFNSSNANGSENNILIA